MTAAAIISPPRGSAGNRARQRPVAGHSDPSTEAPRRPHTLAGPHEARDRAVLHLVARGRTQEQIGRQLVVSAKTVENSAARIRAAYGARNLAHAMAVALARGEIAYAARQAPATTANQRAVLALVAAGWANPEIGAELGHKAQAVGSYLSRLSKAFGAHCRPHLVVEAFRTGVLVADPAGRGLMLAGGES